MPSVKGGSNPPFSAFAIEKCTSIDMKKIFKSGMCADIMTGCGLLHGIIYTQG